MPSPEDRPEILLQADQELAQAQKATRVSDSMEMLEEPLAEKLGVVLSMAEEAQSPAEATDLYYKTFTIAQTAYAMTRTDLLSRSHTPDGHQPLAEIATQALRSWLDSAHSITEVAQATWYYKEIAHSAILWGNPQIATEAIDNWVAYNDDEIDASPYASEQRRNKVELAGLYTRAGEKEKAATQIEDVLQHLEYPENRRPGSEFPIVTFNRYLLDFRQHVDISILDDIEVATLANRLLEVAKRYKESEPARYLSMTSGLYEWRNSELERRDKLKEAA